MIKTMATSVHGMRGLALALALFVALPSGFAEETKTPAPAVPAGSGSGNSATGGTASGQASSGEAASSAAAAGDNSENAAQTAKPETARTGAAASSQPGTGAAENAAASDSAGESAAITESPTSDTANGHAKAADITSPGTKSGTAETDDKTAANETVTTEKSDKSNSGAAGADASPAATAEQDAAAKTETAPQPTTEATGSATGTGTAGNANKSGSAAQNDAKAEGDQNAGTAAPDSTSRDTASEAVTTTTDADRSESVSNSGESGAASAAATAKQPAKEPETNPVTETEAVKPAEKPEAKPEQLTIASYSGAYGASQRSAYFDPYTKRTGTNIELRSNNGGTLESLSAPGWDISDVAASVAEKACEAGVLLELDPRQVTALSGSNLAAGDMLPNAIGKCHVTNMAWSSVIVVHDKAFKGKPPARLEEIFDLEAFPGKRALPLGPRYLFEMLLMADGVAPENVYAELSKSSGVDRALGVLERIRDDIVWWQSAAEPSKLLAAGDVAAAVSFSGRAFNDVIGRPEEYSILWDGQVYDVGAWVVARNTSYPKAAQAFIGYAVQPNRQAEQAKWFPYGPVRRSAVAMVANHPTLGVDMKPYLPTNPQNMKRALRIDHDWWLKNESNLTQRLRTWLAAVPAAEAGAEAETATTSGQGAN